MRCGDNKLGKESNEFKTAIQMVAASQQMRVDVENIATGLTD